MLVASELPEELSVLSDIAGVLDSLKIRFHLGGSFASTIHDQPRQTRDADLVVSIDSGHIKDLVEAVSDRFYVDSIAVERAISKKSCFNLLHLKTWSEELHLEELLETILHPKA